MTGESRVGDSDSHFVMAERSYEWPSAATTGSRMVLSRIGHVVDDGGMIVESRDREWRPAQRATRRERVLGLAKRSRAKHAARAVGCVREVARRGATTDALSP